MRKLLAGLAAIAAFAPSAIADSWVSRDLGWMPSRSVCLDRSESILREYQRQYSAEEVSRGNIAVYAYGIGSSERNVVIYCLNYGGSTYGYMVSHDTRGAQTNKIIPDWLENRYDSRY